MALSVVVGHFGIVGRVGDDWSRFDHRAFTVRSVDGNHFDLAEAGRVTPVGIYIPTHAEAGAGFARSWWDDHLAGRSVTLMLIGPQTREADGSIRARVFVDGTDDIAADAVKAGAAYVDRRGDDPFRPGLSNAEADARKHQRGLWAELKADQQPAWRQAWLKQRGKSTTTRMSLSRSDGR